MSLTAFDYESLSPGIREAVRWLHYHGFGTTDSGDGSNYAAGMEGAMEEPMIYVRVTHSIDLIFETAFLWRLIKETCTPQARDGIEIQAMYNPKDRDAMIVLTGDGLLLMRLSNARR